MAHYTIDGHYVNNIEHFDLVENFLGGKVVKATRAPAPKAGGVAMGAIDAIGGSLGEGKANSALPGSLSFGKSASSSIVDKSCPTCPPVKICPACPPEKICPTCPTCPTCPPEKKSCIIS